MRLARVLPATTFLFFLGVQSAAAQTPLPIDGAFASWLEYSGILAIGWGTGVTGWLVSGHQALSCLFVDMPRAWKLWQNNVLTSTLPIYKYLLGGGLLLVLGTVLIDQLWGFWVEAFDVGLLAGVLVGAGNTLLNAKEFRGQIDFLEANQRFINEKRVSVFTEYDKP